jgi:hypothetical protein
MAELDGDVTANYLQIMRERNLSFSDMADEFARQAEQPSLDGGAGFRPLERWARTEAAAAELRAAAAAAAARPDNTAPPVDPKREQPKRTTVPRPGRQG